VHLFRDDVITEIGPRDRSEAFSDGSWVQRAAVGFHEEQLLCLDDGVRGRRLAKGEQDELCDQARLVRKE
jgi:hypothetical protein